MTAVDLIEFVWLNTLVVIFVEVAHVQNEVARLSGDNDPEASACFTDDGRLIWLVDTVALVMTDHVSSLDILRHKSHHPILVEEYFHALDWHLEEIFLHEDKQLHGTY
jgi:hypothetical protein